MALDPRNLELINAAVDGELQASDQADLQALLQQNAEARSAHDELSRLAETLHNIAEIQPPPHLKHAILDELQSRWKRQSAGAAQAPGFWSGLLSSPVLRYAGAFGVGAVVALVFASSDLNSRHAFDDVTSLVGTIAQQPDSHSANSGARMLLSSSKIAGTVNSHREGSILVIDFNLVSRGPVEIVARYVEGDIWFNGFAQLDGSGTTVSVGSGEVRLQMEGNRRYAVYLHNASGEATMVDLQFYAAGELLHEGHLAFNQVK